MYAGGFDPTRLQEAEIDMKLNEMYLYRYVFEIYEDYYRQTTWLYQGMEMEGDVQTTGWDCDRIESDNPLPAPVPPH